MDDQQDEVLKNRIKQVFDEYEDPAADEGWAQLRKKFPAKDRRKAVLWPWWSAAALALLALTFGIWKFTGNSGQQNTIAVKPTVKTQNNNQQAANHPQTPAPVSTQQNQTIAPANTGAEPANKTNTGNTKLSVNYASVRPASRGAKSIVSSGNTPDNLVTNNSKPVSGTPQSGNKPLLNKADSSKIAANVQAGRLIEAIAPPVVAKPMEPGQVIQSQANRPTPKPKGTTDMIAKNNPQPKKVDIQPARVRFGVYAASYVNYAKGSTNQANVGGGFTAEIRIVKNLKLVTGVTLTQNSLNYSGAVPAGAAQSGLFNSIAAPGFAANANAASFQANTAVTVASVPAFRNYGVSLLNLDIPVNLKYDFNIKRHTFYLMTGLSSGTFANESYTYFYNYPALPSPALQQDHAETAKSNFNNFYVGKMLNLAVGYGYQIGGNRLIIEPFVKYPLGGMGTQNIRFGAGGVNLKINFPTK